VEPHVSDNLGFRNARSWRARVQEIVPALLDLAMLDVTRLINRAAKVELLKAEIRASQEARGNEDGDWTSSRFRALQTNSQICYSGNLQMRRVRRFYLECEEVAATGCASSSLAFCGLGLDRPGRWALSAQMGPWELLVLLERWAHLAHSG